jgi:hypothetical protein
MDTIDCFNYIKLYNHLIGGQEKELGIKKFAFPVISCSSLVVANMMVTGGFHGC